MLIMIINWQFSKYLTNRELRPERSCAVPNQHVSIPELKLPNVITHERQINCLPAHLVVHSRVNIDWAACVDDPSQGLVRDGGWKIFLNHILSNLLWIRHKQKDKKKEKKSYLTNMVCDLLKWKYFHQSDLRLIVIPSKHEREQEPLVFISSVKLTDMMPDTRAARGQPMTQGHTENFSRCI